MELKINYKKTIKVIFFYKIILYAFKYIKFIL